MWKIFNLAKLVGYIPFFSATINTFDLEYGILELGTSLKSVSIWVISIGQKCYFQDSNLPIIQVFFCSQSVYKKKVTKIHQYVSQRIRWIIIYFIFELYLPASKPLKNTTSSVTANDILFIVIIQNINSFEKLLRKLKNKKKTFDFAFTI